MDETPEGCDPIVALQHIIVEEHASQIQEGKPPIKCKEIEKDLSENEVESFKPYNEELRKFESWEDNKKSRSLFETRTDP